ncbi:class II histone deacetylase complex subunits 2 and 3-domain-containing protein [Aspergillus venezuelensis]
MRSKRKAPPVFTTSSPQKPRHWWNDYFIVTSSEEEETSADEIEDEEWDIYGILEETDSQYLIDWVGNYSPTWEPKENASESAVQFWEAARGKEQPAIEKASTSAQTQDSTQSHDSVSERTETPNRQIVLQPSLSPLFVPLYSVSEPHSQDFNEPCQSRLTTRTPSQPCASPKPLPQTQNRAVFEYYPRAPIPPEYCLPGEFEESPSNTSHPKESARTVSYRDSTGTSPKGIRRPGATHTAIAQPSPWMEVPETPSIAWTYTSSQPLRTEPHHSTRSLSLPSKSLSTQTAVSESYRLTTESSSICPNFNPISPVRIPLRDTTCVPESILTSQPLHTPEIAALDGLTGLALSASLSQALANRLPTSGESILLAQPAPCQKHPVLEPVPVSVNSRDTSTTMEDPNQRKEDGSLAPAMERNSQFEGLTPREKMRNLWAGLGEKSTNEKLQTEPSATPSSVGDIEASEPPQIPETVAPLSVRVDKENSHLDIPKESIPETSLEPLQSQEPDIETFQTIHPSALTMSYVEQRAPGSLHLGPSEFAVPLPMDSRVKDDYERVLFNGSPDVYALIDTDLSQANLDTETLVSSMRQVLERLSNAATHPDINVAQHMKDAEPNFQQEAAWADYSSAKFLLLSCLIEAASPVDLHLVVAVRGEKSQKVVERYLQGKGFSYTRPREGMGTGTNVEVSMIKGTLSFGIQTAQSEGIVETYKAPSALIALDSSLNTKSPSVEHMRTTFARNGHLLPVVRLLVASTSEHVELCFPGPSTPEHLSLLLRYSVGLSDVVGDVQDDAFGVHEDANEIMTCLLSDNFNAHWSLPDVEPLREVNLTPFTESEGHGQSITAVDKPLETKTQKRGFVEDSTEPNSKRPRMDESQDTSQLTVSSAGPSQPLGNRLQSFEKQLIKMRSDNEATLEKLQKTLAGTQSRLQEREKVLATLQHRYETRTKDLHIVRKERDHLIEAKTTAEKRLEKSKEEVTKLKDERTTLRHDLEQTRETLKIGGAGGDAAELEKAREEVRRLTKENESLQKKADLANKQTEYIREQYQTASNVAAQSGNELRSLREENEALKRKAAGEAAKLKELNTKSDESRHLSRIRELESLLSSREDLLHKKEDELREIRKNRPSTRSTSTQPRSPKITAGNLSRPTSPGLNNNNGNNYPGRGSALRFSSEMSL